MLRELIRSKEGEARAKGAASEESSGRYEGLDKFKGDSGDDVKAGAPEYIKECSSTDSTSEV